MLTMALTSFTKRNVDVECVYSIALVARAKLGAAASEGDHELRVLVGHANILDGEISPFVQPSVAAANAAQVLWRSS
jgi:hypothetical protein